MSDFERMFPSMDRGVIEDVLRSNKGGVDDTIDQLLLLSMDDCYEEMPGQTYPKTFAHHHQSKVTNLPFTQQPDTQSINRSTFDAIDRPPPSYESLMKKAQSKSKYNPPFVGELPNDFLRVNCKSHRSVDVSDALDDVYAEIDKKRKGRKNEGQATLDVFSTSESSQNRTRPSSNVSPLHKLHCDKTSRQAAKLKELMIENEWKRQVVDDPDVIKYLEDERVALMLQNTEFRKELKRNKEFMNALERDSHDQSISRVSSRRTTPLSVERNPVPDGPLVDRSQEQCSLISRKLCRRRKSKSLREVALPDGPTLDPVVNDIVSDPSNHIRNDCSNPFAEVDVTGGEYGGSLGNVEPFGFTKELPPSVEEDAALSEKLRNMGKASRQKFALLSRQFIGRKRSRSLMETESSGLPLLLGSGINQEEQEENTSSYAYDQLTDRKQ